MARDDYDQEDVRATRSSRRTTQPTDRLDLDDSGPTTASDPNWRRERSTRRRRAASFPTSRQEFALWLQYGGWRIVSIAAAVVVIATLALVFLRGMNRTPLTLATPTPASSAINQPRLTPQPSVTPLSNATASAATQGGSPSGTAVASGSSSGAQFRVTGTGELGLFLRADHNTTGEPVKTLPEGTVVTVVGDDFSGPDRVWKKIRDAEGTEGWAAADFLKPAP
ncbi:MAG TPA: SH3 domain-containing protein [Roseiflexaceae bacterium]|nr:SH3 domain-containing protein [Roseiflexaceae bacterium]